MSGVTTSNLSRVARRRLWEQGKKSKARLEAARNKETVSPVDAATGRPLFRPAINPPQKNLALVLSHGSSRVGERLYTSAYEAHMLMSLKAGLQHGEGVYMSLGHGQPGQGSAAQARGVDGPCALRSGRRELRGG